MAAGGQVVNLLPKSEFDLSFWGRFLKWALTTGRYIIILTELIVIMAFLSRFKLDRDLADLNESIAGKVAVLEAMAATEANFRSVQTRLQVAGEMIEAQMGARELLEGIATKVPSEMRLTNLLLEPQGALVAAQALTEKELGEFLIRMTADQRFSSLDLTDVSADPQQGVKFTLKAAWR